MSEKNIYAINVENKLLNHGPISAISLRFRKNNIANLFERVEYPTHNAGETKRIASIYVTDLEEANKIERDIEETHLYSDVNIECKGKVEDNYSNIRQIITEPENYYKINLKKFLV
jgi:hypothetical protein